MYVCAVQNRLKATVIFNSLLDVGDDDEPPDSDLSTPIVVAVVSLETGLENY